MANLELTDDEKIDFPRPIPMRTPDYPCNAMFALTEREFEKMGCDPADADLGAEVKFTGTAIIKHIDPPERDKRSGRCRIEFQMTDLEFGAYEDGESEGDEKNGKPY